MITILSHRKIKAAKDHECYYCNGHIRKGLQYINQSCSADGSAYTIKMHPSCHDLAVAMKMYDEADEGLSSEDFQEVVSAKFHKLCPEFHIKTTFLSKLHVVKMQVLYKSQNQ